MQDAAEKGLALNMLQKIVSVRNAQLRRKWQDNIKMGLRDLFVRTERGCANCSTAVSNGTLGGPSMWNIAVLTAELVQ